jgi:hypothetical protein
MPTVKFRNQTGNVTIDGTYQNLALRTKGSITTAPTNIAGLSSVNLTLPCDQGVLAFRCPNPCAIMQVTYSGGNATYRISTTGGNSVVDYWHFDLPQYAAGPANWPKLIVRDPSNGRIIFDSRLNYMRVIDFIQLDINNNANPNPYSPNYVGKVPAIIQAKRAWLMLVEFLPGTPTIAVGGWTSSFVSTPSTQCNFYKNLGYYNFNDQPANSQGYPSAESTQSSYMVVDVSNF